MAEYKELIKQYYKGEQDTFQNNMTSAATLASSFSDTDDTNLRYPLDESKSEYGGTITFKARQQKYQTLGDAAVGLLEDEGGRLGLTDSATSVNLANFTSSVDRNYTATDRIGKRKCTLYLPSAIQIRDQVSYSNEPLGAMGAGIRAGIRSNQSASELVSAAVGGIGDTFGSLIGAIKSGTEFAKTPEAQVAALKVFRSSSTVSGAISSATGVALNPNRRSILNGPELRTFTFTFQLIPTSKAEAVSIERIIQFFREEMYPEAQLIGGISAAYSYPSIFDIIMRYRTTDGKYKKVATQILPSFLTGVDVNYNQSGMSFHSDGRPQEASLTLNFTEERTLDKFDVAERGY